MSDILIRGMKMSENCEDCQLATVGSFGTFCPLKKCSIKKGYSFKYCPLVALPEHGRLIDADDLEKHMTGLLRHDYVFDEVGCFGLVRNAPTVLEAGNG